MCSLENSTRLTLPTSTADVNMEMSGTENVKNKRKGSTQ